MLALGLLEAGDTVRLCVENGREAVFDELGSGRCEPDEYPPTVVGVWVSGDQASALEAMQPNRHASSSQEQGVGELRGGTPVLGVDPVQLHEGVEVALMTQSVACRNGVKLRLEVAGGAKNTGYDREGGGVEVRSAPGPFVQDVVYPIRHEASPFRAVA